MVKDFISCMDRARRKYTQMKEGDPSMKLVPLLLSEWLGMYPTSTETVKTFLDHQATAGGAQSSLKNVLGRIFFEVVKPPSLIDLYPRRLMQLRRSR